MTTHHTIFEIYPSDKHNQKVEIRSNSHEQIQTIGPKYEQYQ